MQNKGLPPSFFNQQQNNFIWKALSYYPEILRYATGSPVYQQTRKYLQLRAREEKESQQVWSNMTFICATKTAEPLISQTECRYH